MSVEEAKGVSCQWFTLSAPPDVSLCASPSVLFLAHSLGYNELCGIDENGEGTYTVEGITAIAEALKVNTTIKNLECVAISTCREAFTPSAPPNANCTP